MNLKSASDQAIQATLDVLARFIGVWSGRGKGGYPTLDAFEYAETLRVYQVPGTSFVSYEQNTQLIDPDGRVIRQSHWEAGLLRPLGDGSIELACAQGGGRVEVLRGRLLTSEQNNLITLGFESKFIGNDERIVGTSREWCLTDNHLTYIMKMTTSTVAELTLHLEANLFRS